MQQWVLLQYNWKSQWPDGKFVDRVGSTAVGDCLDCASEALKRLLNEGFDCTSWGQSVPFINHGFYKNNVSDVFSILKCFPSSECLSSRNETACAIGYQGVGCSFCMNDFYRNGSLCLPCGSAFWRWILAALFYHYFLSHLETVWALGIWWTFNQRNILKRP